MLLRNIGGVSTPADRRRPKSWHRLAGLPVRVWMVVLIGIGLAHWALPDARWLLVHVFTIGLVTNSIVLWSQTLAERFLGYPLPEARRPRQLARIYALNAGLVVTIVGMLGAWWPVTMAGAIVIGGVVAWHCAALARLIVEAQRHREAAGEGPAENALNAWFFVVAASLLPVGAGFGVALAYGFADPEQAGFLVTHQALNILGFLGITAAGVLMLMFPRLLGAAKLGQRRRPYALVVLPTGIAITIAGALSDHPVLAAAGIGVYLAGWLIVAGPFVPAALANPPRGYAPASICAALLWLFGSLIAYATTLITGPFVTSRITLLTVWFLAGFAGQLLFGVMSHLIPTMMGPGPVAAAGKARMDRWWLWRVLVINGGLVLWLLPLDSWVKVAVSSLVMLAFIMFLPIMIAAARAAMTARKALAEPEPAESRSGSHIPVAPESRAPRTPQLGLQAVAAAAALALVVSVGLALGGGSGGQITDASGGVTPTGHTTTAKIAAVGMRFTPDTISVPAGDRLVIEVTNKDSQVHDLVLATGATTGRIAPGATAKVDAGVIGRSIEGWCSIVGHRQQGMVLHIRTSGGTADDGGATAHAQHSGHGGPPVIDLQKRPGPGFTARDARLAPAPGGALHRVTFEVTEGQAEVAPGVRQTVWTYNGKPMGPTLRGRLGDVFEVTLVNHGTMAHSVDFHAGMVSPDQNMRDIDPGQTLVYRFRAEHTGIWLYHCATAPMAAHLAAGMYGAVVIDPPDLAPVSAEYLFVQAEAYLGANGDPVDADKVAANTPDLVMFNGYANQYVYRPLHAKVGDRIRMWVLDAGPNVPLAFHVIGTQFDVVYSEGAYLLPPGDPAHGGSQGLALQPAQGGFVEMTFAEPGTYTFLNHRMVDGDRGAMGKIVVTE